MTAIIYLGFELKNSKPSMFAFLEICFFVSFQLQELQEVKQCISPLFIISKSGILHGIGSQALTSNVNFVCGHESLGRVFFKIINRTELSEDTLISYYI